MQLGPQPDKLIKKLDNQTKERIRNRLLKLQEDPFPPEVEGVEGYKGEKVFSVRVGDYRIPYIVRYESNLILVSKVDKRGRVYS
ncbi:type II toxin-antitoxin system RelE/ParE family toxin [Candidatus Woesearchaeota archaeon]|nr:type II toxin-antitoxin system RelE/ParE family toxin [Candidatus Woesearchaeota archaeon]